MQNSIFASEKKVLSTTQLPHWKVLIVDDEPLVHQVTKSVLTNITIDSRKVEFLSAFSAQEAMGVMRRHDDIAVIFLDVVMETPDAGLTICRDIREKLNNHLVQIILRTGQPGSNPENDIVLKYKINGYKDKTELSAQKLFTCLVSALRSYQDLVNIKKSKVGLSKVIAATQQINQSNSVPLFMDGVLSQVVTLIDNCKHSFVFEMSSTAELPETVRLMSSFGDEQIDKFEDFKRLLQRRLLTEFKNKQPLESPEQFIQYFNFGERYRYVLFLETDKELSTLDLELLQLLSSNIQIALDNLFNYQVVISSQQEVIIQLFNALRAQVNGSSSSVKIILNVSLQLCFDADVGKGNIRLIETLLSFNHQAFITPSNKPRLLREDDHDVNKNTLSLVLKQLNERFDGTGFPSNLTGNKITLAARIITLASVLESLLSNRAYKKALTFDASLSIIEGQSGRHFDPTFVDCLINNKDQYKKIVEKLKSGSHDESHLYSDGINDE